MYFKEAMTNPLDNFESFQNSPVFVAVVKDYTWSPCSVLLSEYTVKHTRGDGYGWRDKSQRKYWNCFAFPLTCC